MNDQLDIVNENDEVIGQESRKKIHTEGLLHREIHVWFYTPKGEIIFQHRAKDKETYPDLLDATVGGHVDTGMNYEDTAVKEMSEETGIITDVDNLRFIRKLKNRSVDEVTHAVNYAFTCQYAYLFMGSISDLKIEEGKAVGFEAWTIDKLLNLNDEEKLRFIPKIISAEHAELFTEIKKLL